MSNYFDQYDNIQQDSNIQNPAAKKKTDTTLSQDIGDVGISALKGAVAIPDAVIGLADAVTRGFGLQRSGTAIRDTLANRDGLIGIDPQRANKILSDNQSEGYKAKQQEFSDQKGFWDSAAYIAKNPTLAINAAAESVPSMVAGGALGLGAKAAAAGGARALGLAGRKLSDVAAAAIGEGAIMAGGQAANIQEETGGLTHGQALASLATGAIGGGLGFIGGKAAKELGLADVDTYIAAKMGGKQIVGEASKAAGRITSIPNAALKGAIAEGLMEEVPQSVAETVIGNLATDKHWSEGLDKSVAMGLITGGLMGGTFGGISGYADYKATKADPLQGRAKTSDEHLADINNGKDADVEAYNDAALRSFGQSPYQDEIDNMSINQKLNQLNQAAPFGDASYQDMLSNVGQSDVAKATITPSENLQILEAEENTAYEELPTRPSESLGLSRSRGILEATAADAVDMGVSSVSAPAVAPVSADVAAVVAGSDSITGTRSQTETQTPSAATQTQSAQMDAEQKPIQSGAAVVSNDVPADAVSEPVSTAPDSVPVSGGSSSRGRSGGSASAIGSNAPVAAPANQEASVANQNIEPLKTPTVKAYRSADDVQPVAPIARSDSDASKVIMPKGVRLKEVAQTRELISSEHRKTFKSLPPSLQRDIEIYAEYSADHSRRLDSKLPDARGHYPQFVRDAVKRVVDAVTASPRLKQVAQHLANKTYAHRSYHGWSKPLPMGGRGIDDFAPLEAQEAEAAELKKNVSQKKIIKPSASTYFNSADNGKVSANPETPMTAPNGQAQPVVPAAANDAADSSSETPVSVQGKSGGEAFRAAMNRAIDVKDAEARARENAKKQSAMEKEAAGKSRDDFLGGYSRLVDEVQAYKPQKGKPNEKAAIQYDIQRAMDVIGFVRDGKKGKAELMDALGAFWDKHNGAKQAAEQVRSATQQAIRNHAPTRSRGGLGASDTDTNIPQSENARYSRETARQSPETAAIRNAVKQAVGAINARHIDFSTYAQEAAKRPKDAYDLLTAQGWYDRNSKRVTLISDRLDERTAKFTAWHELGHRKIDVSGFNKWKSLFKSAYNGNSTLRELAHAVREQRADMDDPAARDDYVAVEEAAVELYSAWKNNDYAMLEEKYGVTVPVEMRGNKLQRFFAKLIGAMKTILKRHAAIETDSFGNDKLMELLRRIDTAKPSEKAAKPESGDAIRYIQNEDAEKFSRYSDDADKVYRAAEKMGLYARRETSRASDSEYVYIYRDEAHNDTGEIDGVETKAVKVRVSDHELPDRYREDNVRNFNVFPRRGKMANSRGENAVAHTDGSWTDAIAFAAEHYGAKMPAYVQRIYDKEQAALKAEQEARERAEAERLARVKLFAENKEASAAYEKQKRIERVAVNLDTHRRNLEFLENMNVAEYKRSGTRKNAVITDADGKQYQVRFYLPAGDIVPASFELVVKELKGIIAEAEQLQGGKKFSRTSDDRRKAYERPKAESLKKLRKADNEPRDLMVTHNIAAHSIIHADKMGGLPYASVAVTKADNPLHNFGDVTLIADRDFIDPKGANRAKVFGSDIYSPRYPTVNYHVSDKDLNSIYAEFSADAKTTGDSGLHHHLYRNVKTEGLKKVLSGSPAVMHRFLRENGITPPVVRHRENPDKADAFETMLALRGAVKQHKDDFDAFVDGYVDSVTVSEKIPLGNTPSGRQRSAPHTLENVAKLLKKGIRGGERLNYGLPSVRAKVTPQFKSLEAIKKAKGRLLSPEDFRAVKEEMDKEADRIGDKIGVGRHDFPAFLDSLLSDGIGVAAKRYGMTQSDANMAEVSGFLDKLKAMPTEYFEAKVKDVVRFSDFAGAVVPAGISKAARDVLERAGLPLREYAENESREAVVSAFVRELDAERGNILFSRKTATRQRYEQRIDELFSGAKPSLHNSVTVLDRADMLDMLGYGNMPLLLNENKVIAGQKNHPLITANVWKQIPDWVDNPAMVFDSDTVDGRLVFIAPEKVRGNDVRIIIEPNGNALDMHVLMNAYDVKSEVTPYTRWARDGLLRYVDKAKAARISERFRLQLPSILKNPSLAPDRRIHGTVGGNAKDLRLGKILTEKNLQGYRRFNPFEDEPLKFARAKVKTTKREALSGNIAGAINAVTNLNRHAFKELADGKRIDAMAIGLQALGRRQIVDIYGKMIPELENYDTLSDRFGADGNMAAVNADKLVTAWGKLKDADALAELMHDATLAKIDADPQVKPHISADKGKLAELQRRFNGLSEEAIQVYRKARDDYKAHFDAVQQAMKERMERAGVKREAFQAMEQRFADALQGVYFPLARFGKYVVAVKNENGKVVSISRAETMREAEALRKSFIEQFPKSRGFDVGRVMLDKEYAKSRDAVSRGFMKELFDAMENLNFSTQQFVDIEDTLNQLYLNSVPDLSWAKHGIHRKGTAGFSDDARRAYAQNMFHGATYLAKLRYSDLMEQSLSEMQEQVDKAAKADKAFNQPEAQRVVDEMVKRHDVVMNPKSNKISTALTSFGFLYYLGLSPASAAVNLSQTALVAYPVMAAKWGAGKAGKALLAASKQAASKNGGYNNIRESLNDDEKAAFDKAVSDGVIDISQAHDLAGIAQGEDSGVLWKMRRVMQLASWLFHQAELFNRQVTFIAAYRLAKAQHGDSDKAFSEAKKATYDGHFDYSAQNRPRFMMGNAAKVVLLFKQYAQNMVYTLSRNAYLSAKGDKQAMKTLAGVLVSHALAAGVLGLPAVSVLLSAASWLGSSDDEPWDAEAALRNQLAEIFGQKGSEVISKGVSRLTPWDISGRVSLNNLIFPDIQEGLQGARAAESFAAGMMGPVLGIGLNAAKGVNLWADGNYGQGLEQMLPVSVRNPLKALRFARDGHIDRSGIAVKDDFGVSEIAGQALGFSPSDLRLKMEGKGSVYRADNAVRKRRTELLSRMVKAVIDKDKAAGKEIQADIMKFNAKNPMLRITVEQVSASVKARLKRAAEAKNGVYLPKTRQQYLEAGAYAFDDGQ